MYIFPCVWIYALSKFVKIITCELNKSHKTIKFVVVQLVETYVCQSVYARI